MFGKKPKVKLPLTVFLDVDGVLNKQSDWSTAFTLNEECISAFSKLWQELSKYYIPKLVLISTWRSGKGREQNTESYDYLVGTLKGIGIKISDTTPLTNKGRQNEVEYYIRRNRVGNYVILDDDESLYDQPEKLCIYYPEYTTGLEESDVKKIVNVIMKRK